jgi:Putative zinc-finger/HEAT repeats
MKCEEYQELFTDWLDNQLPAAECAKIEQHIAGCPECREELAVIQHAWDMMGEFKAPEPSAAMKVNFQAMLNEYKESVQVQKDGWENLKERFSSLWQLQPRWPLAYSLVIAVVCLGGAFWFAHNSRQEQQLDALTSQVHELKQTMMLALLQNPSASERIRGVSYTSEIKHADKEVIDALLATLNNDPNVNVRLSTLDALTQLAGHPEVREGLIKSIAQQDSPLMQSAIADVMLKLQEKRSVNSFKELLKQKNLDQGVRDKIKETITQLI